MLAGGVSGRCEVVAGDQNSKNKNEALCRTTRATTLQWFKKKMKTSLCEPHRLLYVIVEWRKDHRKKQ